MQCVSYNTETSEIVITEYRNHTGRRWSGKPFYLIRCTCGYPLKFMVRGLRPKTLLEASEISHHGSKEKFVIVKNADVSWSATFDDELCPCCHAAVAIGPGILTAVERFIRTHLEGHRNYNREKIQVSRWTPEAARRIVKIPTVKFSRECVAERSDFAIVWKTGNEERDISNSKKWDEWYGIREKELEGMKHALRLDKYTGDDHKTEESPYDFSAEVMDAHGEDCTCNLCMK